MEQSHCCGNTERDESVNALCNDNTLRHLGRKDKDASKAKQRDHGEKRIDQIENPEKVTDALIGDLLRPIGFHFYLD